MCNLSDFWCTEWRLRRRAQGNGLDERRVTACLGLREQLAKLLQPLCIFPTGISSVVCVYFLPPRGRVLMLSSKASRGVHSVTFFLLFEHISLLVSTFDWWCVCTSHGDSRYSFRVRAANDVGPSVWSAVVNYSTDQAGFCGNPRCTAHHHQTPLSISSSSSSSAAAASP